jgi:DNA-binding NtrC family response regulator
MNPFHNYTSILIVDDDAFVLSALKMTLEMEQFEVTTCSNPIEALRLLTRREFTVIISDHRMPGMTGLAFLAECRRLCPHTPRILLTAVVELATVMAAINRGGEICHFMSKPWRQEQLIAAVRAAAQKHQLATRTHASQTWPVRRAPAAMGEVPAY